MQIELIQNGMKDISPDCLTELRMQRNLFRRVNYTGGALVQNSRNDESGVSARVRADGAWGFASMPEVSGEALRKVLRNAESNARFLAGKNLSKGAALPGIKVSGRRLESAFGDPEQAVYHDVCKKVDQYIVEHFPKLHNRQVIAYADTVEKIIAFSGGEPVHIATPRSYLYLVMSAKAADGSIVEIFKAVGGYGDFAQNFQDLSATFEAAEKLYRSVLAKAEGITPKPGLKTCILSGHLAGMLAHEAVGHTVEADFVLGGSVAGKLMGKQVAAPGVTLVDFAHTAFGQPVPLPVYVDDEGVEAEDAVIIENGILTSYMHNRESAQRFGMKAQGNARAWLFSDEPLIRMRNTAILPGKNSFEEMIASVEDGYYLCGTGNGQADTTGEFMFGITEGYEIKDGKLGKALRDTTISGVAFEMLKTVDMLSDQMEWASAGFCGKKQPMAVGMGGPAVRCRVMMGGQ